MDEPEKPSHSVLFNIVEVFLSAILIFLILNLVNRTDATNNINPYSLKISDYVLTSIAFCILELVSLLAALIFLKTAKFGPRSYLMVGFVFFLIELLFFIIESSTFYHQYFYDPNSLPLYDYQTKIKQNNYQVVIEVILRVGGLGALATLVFRK